jgi:hypothetical protein
MLLYTRHRIFGPGLATTALVLVTGLLGCGPVQSTGVQTQFRDSAGITIVESTALPEQGAEGWAIGQNPTLSIGTLDGDTLYQLYEVSDGLILPDGRIVISDNGSFQLRIFGADGTFQGSFGREGEGPGEFKNIRVLGVVEPDTLVVLDGAQRRISLYDPEGGFHRQVTLQDEVGVAYFSNGMFSDGSIVFGGGLTFGPGGDLPSDGLQRNNTSFQSVGLDGQMASDFGELPGVEIIMRSQGSGGEMFISASVIHFGKRPSAFARGDRLVLGSGDSYEASFFRRDGVLDRIIRVLIPPTPVTSREVDQLLEDRVAALDDPDDAPATRSSFGDIPHADFMPAYQDFFLDSEGFLWIESYRTPGVGFRSWTLFDSDGIPRTRLSLPRTNRLLDVGRSTVLTVFEDDLGVEYLRVFPLTRGG